MYSWTTPTNTFQTNIDLTQARVYLTYARNGRVLLEFTNERLIITEDSVTVKLTQADTAKLWSRSNSPVEIQIRYVTEDGIADASNIMEATVERVLKDGEIQYVPSEI